MASKTPDLLMVGEVAKILRVNPKTVSLWTKNGRIPPAAILKTVGGHRRIRRSFVDAYLRGQRVTPAEDLLRRNRALIRQVPCPQCDAPVMAPCRLPSGGVPSPDHQARRHAAADAGAYIP